MDGSPPGELQLLFVDDEERNTHVEHGGAKTKHPPGLVFQTCRPGPELEAGKAQL